MPKMYFIPSSVTLIEVDAPDNTPVYPGSVGSFHAIYGEKAAGLVTNDDAWLWNDLSQVAFNDDTPIELEA